MRGVSLGSCNRHVYQGVLVEHAGRAEGPVHGFISQEHHGVFQIVFFLAVGAAAPTFNVGLYVIKCLVVPERRGTMRYVRIEITAVPFEPDDANGACSYDRPKLFYCFVTRAVEANLISFEYFSPFDIGSSMISPGVEDATPHFFGKWAIKKEVLGCF